MAAYTDQQVFKAFMAGANRGLEEWDNRKRTNSRSRNAVLSKLTRKWRHHIWDNIVADRPYWEQPNRKKQAAASALTHYLGSCTKPATKSESSPILVEPPLKFARRPRELRKPFVAAIVITDVVSERQISAHTSNLSVHGCFVSTPTPLNLGVKVQITVVYAGAKVVASGRVASTRADGMGIAFTKLEQDDQAVLDRWISDLRTN